MSILKTIKAQLGLSNTPANNFTITAEADNGTLKLARGNAGSTTQDILTVDASGNVNAPVGIQKAGSVLQALSDFTGTNVSLSANGYQKLPSGLIIQYGNYTASFVVTAGSYANKAVTFPIAFPNANLFSMAMPYGLAPSTAFTSCSAESRTTSGFSGVFACGTTATLGGFGWLSIGY